MSAKPDLLPNSRLYEQDYAAWATETGRLIREGRFAGIDREFLADEIESMARSDKHQLENRREVLIRQLLKWQKHPEKRSRSWRLTMLHQRNRIERLCRQSPSLRRLVPRIIAEVYAEAVEAAGLETRLPAGAFPKQCPFSAAEILDFEFFPD